MMENDAGAKASLRSEMAARVAALAPDYRRRSDARICAHLIALPEYRAARQLLAYSALKDEVSLSALFERAERDDKAIFLPVADATARTVSFLRWSIAQPLRRSSLGVLEPSCAAASAGAPERLRSIVLVPGRAFDRGGGRLGRGGGFYDRALDELAGFGLVVGVAYAVQLLASVPVGPLDRHVDAVVSEQGLQRADRC
jgi:5-formyltetrahydrofolate cyclo-ligase